MSKLPFNVAYLDVNDEMRENFSMTPSTYGGGRIVAASFLDLFDNFHIYGPGGCFKEVQFPKNQQCHILQNYERKAIREGADIDQVIGSYMSKNYDLIVHHFSNIHINTKLPTLCWPVGYAEPIHPDNKHIALFDIQNQAPQFFSNNHSIYNVVIGPRMPEFQEYEKQDFIYCCGRLTRTYQSIQIAQLATKYEIPIVFSGPIDRGHPFLDYLSDYVTYLGVVDNETKVEYNKKAKMTAQMMNYPISVTLSMKEAAAVGVGCLAMPVGQYRSWLRPSINGFFVRSEEEFVQGWERRDELNQKSIYDSVQMFSENNMINKFIEAFKLVVNHG